MPENTRHFMYVGHLNCYVLVAENWLLSEKPRFINGQDIQAVSGAGRG